jgi:hypothetical protein
MCDHGCVARPGTITPELLTEARRLRASGASLALIAERLGASPSSILRALRRSDVAHSEVQHEPPLPSTAREGSPPALEPPAPVGSAELVERLRAQRVAAEPPPEPVDEPDPETDPAGYLRARMRAGAALARNAEAAGNLSVAQRASRDVAALASVLSRLEREARDQSDAIVMTRDEWALAEASVKAKLEALAARPLLCAACNRELSIAWGDCQSKIDEIDAADAAAERGAKL